MVPLQFLRAGAALAVTLAFVSIHEADTLRQNRPDNRPAVGVAHPPPGASREEENGEPVLAPSVDPDSRLVKLVV